MSDLQEMYDMVWDFRREMESYFPTPETAEDNIRYAITEVSEALDADLRNRRTNDKRNQDKRHSVERELAQATMMYLTALGPDCDVGDYDHYNLEVVDMDKLVCMAIGPLQRLRQGRRFDVATRIIIACIANYVPNLKNELAAALEQLRRKHKPPICYAVPEDICTEYELQDEHNVRVGETQWGTRLNGSGR